MPCMKKFTELPVSEHCHHRTPAVERCLLDPQAPSPWKTILAMNQIFTFPASPEFITFPNCRAAPRSLYHYLVGKVLAEPPFTCVA